jgi:hypothetical protein
MSTQFEDRCRFTGAEFDPPVRDEIERRDAFSDASRMIVAWRHEHDAVAEADALCALRARGNKAAQGIPLECRGQNPIRAVL